MAIIPKVNLFVEGMKKKLGDWLPLKMNEFGETLRYLPEEWRKTTEEFTYLPKQLRVPAKKVREFITPESPEEAIKYGLIPYPTKEGKHIYVDPLFGVAGMRMVGGKLISKAKQPIFKGLKNLTTRLIEKFRGMTSEITEQQFRTVLNKAEKEGIKKADKDLIVGLVDRQSKELEPITKIAKRIEKEFLDIEVFIGGGRAKGRLTGDLDVILRQEPKAGEVKRISDLLKKEYGVNEAGYFIDKTKPGINVHFLTGEPKVGAVPIGEFYVQPKINLTKLASDVEEQLVPLTATPVRSPRWSSVGEDFIGDGKYGEIVYQSPIKTSAGEVHFSVSRSFDLETFPKRQEFSNYFSHTRFEDLADGKTRKILETQSDLFQKGGLEREIKTGESLLRRGAKSKGLDKEMTELEKLQPYSSNDPLANLRTFREEVKRAAKDGKDTLLIPSGKTAMKIEGLGERGGFTFRNRADRLVEISSNDLKVGLEINQGGEILGVGEGRNKWIITEVLEEGKFKAISTEHISRALPEFQNDIQVFRETGKLTDVLEPYINRASETFDISGKVDTQHFVYKLNESAIPKEARKMGLIIEGKINVDNGEWWKILIPSERARMPVEAFGAGLIPLSSALQENQNTYNKNKEGTIPFVPRNEQLFIKK